MTEASTGRITSYHPNDGSLKLLGKLGLSHWKGSLRHFSGQWLRPVPRGLNPQPFSLPQGWQSGPVTMDSPQAKKDQHGKWKPVAWCALTWDGGGDTERGWKCGPQSLLMGISSLDRSWSHLWCPSHTSQRPTTCPAWEQWELAGCVLSLGHTVPLAGQRWKPRVLTCWVVCYGPQHPALVITCFCLPTLLPTT